MARGQERRREKPEAPKETQKRTEKHRDRERHRDRNPQSGGVGTDTDAGSERARVKAMKKTRAK